MAFLELLVEGNKRREGSGKPSSQIVAIGSVGGLTRFTDSFIYNASKAAVHHLMKNLGAHFVPFDVRCNVIAPGCEFLLRFHTHTHTMREKQFNRRIFTDAVFLQGSRQI